MAITGHQTLNQAFDGRLGGIAFVAAERSIRLEAGEQVYSVRVVRR